MCWVTILQHRRLTCTCLPVPCGSCLLSVACTNSWVVHGELDDACSNALPHKLSPPDAPQHAPPRPPPGPPARPRHRSQVLLNSAPSIAWVTCVATFVAAYATAFENHLLPAMLPALDPGPACSAFINQTGVALSLLLVFRTDESYSR